MQLSESKLFTIEALNRIEWFAWPDGAETARVDAVKGDNLIHFFCGSVWIKTISYSSQEAKEINWRNSLITREQFESVDGWVRNDGSSRDIKLGKLIDVIICSGKYFGAVLAGDCFWSGAGIENVDKWRHHKPQKEKGMTLLEILVRELPKRGGWPSFADACVQNSRGNVIMLGEGYDVKFDGAGWGLKYGVKKSMDGNFASSLLATDHATKIVTRAEYEAAANSKRVINAGEAEITIPGKVHQTEIKATVGMEEKGEAQKDLEDWNAKVMKAVDDGLIQDLYALNDAISKEFNEKSEELNKLAKSRSEIVSAIKAWHKERGFDVSESSGEPFIRNCGLNDRFPDYRHKPLVNFGSSDVKPKLNPIVKVDVKLESELKITDWRDLRVGDVISVSSYNGGDLTVKEFRLAGIILGCSDGDYWLPNGWPFKFIRRPQ